MRGKDHFAQIIPGLFLFLASACFHFSFPYFCGGPLIPGGHADSSWFGSFSVEFNLSLGLFLTAVNM